MIKLSRSKLELFFECPRCFWMYAGKGINRPSGFPFTINNAIDFLLKQEFDTHRKNGTAHALIKRERIDAVPFMHEDIDKWRHNFTGIQHLHAETDFLVFGAVDDIWVDPKGNLIVVDYKASGAKKGELYPSYKRQMEIYQWLLRQNGFAVSNRGYFVYARVDKEKGFIDGNLKFTLDIEPYDGDDSWVLGKIREAKECLNGPLPQPDAECKYCIYRKKAATINLSPSA